MQTKTLSVEVIQDAIKNGAKSLTDISRFLGHKGSISGKLSKQIRNLVPNVAERLKSNTSQTPKPSKPSKKSEQPKKVKHSGKYPRHPKNVFRDGSGYGLAFDILASHTKGIARSELVEKYAKASGKDLKKASFDIAVLLSPKSEKPTSDRHKSCREGYGLIKEGSHYTIVLPKEG